MAAGIAEGEIVHADASLIRADVAWESLAVRHVEAVVQADGGDAAGAKLSRSPGPKAERDLRDAQQTGRLTKVCTTDPAAGRQGMRHRSEHRRRRHHGLQPAARAERAKPGGRGSARWSMTSSASSSTLR